jgi:hypothetical protein
MNREVNLTPDEQKLILDYRLEKGVITDDLYKAATDQLEKGGAGSKGGVIIGHTESGKPIYKTNHDSYKDFTSADHKDAAEAHKKKFVDAKLKGKSKDEASHRKMHAFHKDK